MTTFKPILQPTHIRDVPFTSIGVSDLCSVETNWKGYLRKEGLLERGFQKSPFSKINIQWRRYFVVLSQGCVYVFTEESSSSPKKYFSLKDYIKLQRLFGEHVVQNAFELVPKSEGGKIHRFCCTTDTERLEWMKAFYISLLATHKQQIPDFKHAKKKGNEYKMLESEILKSNKSQSELPEALYEVDEDSTDEEQVYDEPEDPVPKDKPSKPKNKYAPDPTSFKYKATSDNKTASKQSKGPITSPKVKRSCSLTSVSEKFDNIGRAISPNSHRSSVKQAKAMFEQINMKGASSLTNLSEEKTSVTKGYSDKRYINSSAKTKITKDFNDKYQNSATEEALSNTGEVSSGNKTYLNMDDPGYVDPNSADNPYMEYMFDGDKQDSARALEISHPRTFLIRNSSEPGKKVLVVKNIDRNLKSFKIEGDASTSNYHIELYVTFKTLRDLVEYYKRHNLPNIGFTLRLGYNAREGEPDEDGYEPVAKPWKPR